MLIILVLCLVSAALAQTIPEDILHDAVMTLTWEDDGGECWVEGHVILGEADKGATHEVYAYVFYQNFGFMDGVFTDVGGGAIGPRTFVFDKTADGGYMLREVIHPEDGEDYGKSIEAMMPADCVQKMSNGFVDRDELVRQQHVQARAYLDGIGRTADIQDWRERGLDTADILVHAGNQIISLSPPWPLWITSTERIEGGERYVYTRSWYPDEGAVPEESWETFTGEVHTSGVTGTQVLTKMRYADSKVVETVIIRADNDLLTVTMRDDFGSKTYTFRYDGRTYHRPEVTLEGDCRVSYPEFDRQNEFLPE